MQGMAPPHDSPLMKGGDSGASTSIAATPRASAGSFNPLHVLQRASAQHNWWAVYAAFIPRAPHSYSESGAGSCMWLQ